MTLEVLAIRCPSCGGAKIVQHLTPVYGEGHKWEAGPCSTCNGTGVFPPDAAEAPPCTWRQDSDPDSDAWWTACGNGFTLNAPGTPTEHDFRYCCYCGGPLISAPYVPERDDDPVHPEDDEQ
jgi:hypothetical protein